MKYLSNAGLTKLVELINEKFATKTELSGKANSTHTHDYAGSATAGGAATSANKINTDAGSQTQPVYFNNGIPVATKYTLNKTVPADAVFTDTTYENATTSAAGLMSADDKTKLNGIATNANNYTHPTSTASGSYGPSQNASPAHSGTFSVPYVTVDGNGHVSAASTKTITLPSNPTMGAASASADGTAGLVPAPTKGNQGKFLRADGTWQAANNYSHPNSGVTAGTYGPSDNVSGSNGTKINVPEIVVDAAGHITSISNKEYTSVDHTYSNATTSAAGLMSADDKTKLNGIAANANNYTHPNTVTAGTAGTSSATNGVTLAVPYVTYNANGHITATGTHTHTVSGMTGASVDAAGTTGLVPAPAKGDQAKFLRADGTWQAANNYSHPSDGSNTGSFGPSANASPAHGAGFSVPYITVNAAGHVTAASTKTITLPAQYSHPTSGVTAASYGPTDNASPAHGGTFSVPSVTVDANGHITAASTKTITLPADNNTDTKVTNTLGTTTKFYVTGTTSATTNTGTQYFDTGVYVSATAGELVATKFTGALNGKANDSDKLGGTAASSYALKSYVDTKVSDLVGSAPETLDTLGELAAALGKDINLSTSIATQIGSKVTTGSADYIKSASVSGKTLTLTKGDDTTVAFTETNTTYSAGSGLSLSGTTFNHASTVTAGTAGTSSATSGITLAVPYVTYNATGHVTAAGTHTHTVPTFTKSGTSAAAGLVPAPSTTAGTTKYLREDGTWTVPPNDNTVYSHPSDGTNTGSFGPSANASPAHGGTFSVPYFTVNAAGHVTAASTKTITLPAIYSHPNSGATAGSYGPSDDASPAHGGTFSVPYVTVNAAGHVTAASTKTITLPADNDTKNTAGSTDTSSKIFLVGAASQAANPQTYSHDTAFVDANGRLNSAAPATDANDTTVATTKWVKDQSYTTATGHSHNYAGSSSAGGAATSLANFKVTTTTNNAIDTPGSNAIAYASGLTKANWNYQQTDGGYYCQWYSASWWHEIFGDYRTGQISVRGNNNGTKTNWRRVLDESNYSTIIGTTYLTASSTLDATKLSGTIPAACYTNTQYSAATTSAAGLMSAADKTKLNGIATGATADSTLSDSEIETAWNAA